MKIAKKLNKRGASSIEIVIGFMVLILMLAFLIDIIDVITKYSVVAQVNTEVARISGVQGGLLNTSPNGWPGGNSNYVTMARMETIVGEKFASAGVSDSAWQIRMYDSSGVSSGRFGEGTNTAVSLDYLTNYTVEVRVNYSWRGVSAFLPGTIQQTLVSRRPATSEWKYNYNDWIGE